jgi:hypothetical protein
LANNTCTTCSDNTYAVREFNPETLANFFTSNVCTSDFYEYCELVQGWRFSDNKIYPGNNLPPKIELILSRNINVVNSGAYLSIDYEVSNLKEDEFFFVYINDFKKEIKLTEKSAKINLDEGNNLLKIVYKRGESKNYINPLVINKISIYGSDEGVATTCIKCPEVKYKINI